MIRYMIAFNTLALYIIYLAGRLRPHPLTPMHGPLDYIALVVAGVNTLIAIVAILRWKEIDQW